MATSFTTHSAGQVIASADINLIQTAVNTLENGVHPEISTNFHLISAGSDIGGQSFKGCLWTPTSNCNAYGMAVQITSATSGASYQGKIVTLASNAVGSTTVATVVGSTAVLTNGTNTGGGILEIAFTSPVALTGGTTYALLMGSTSNAGSVSTGVTFAHSFGTPTTTGVAGVLGDVATCAVTGGPVVSSAVTVTAATNTRIVVAVWAV